MKHEYFDIQRRVVANKTLEGWRNAPHASIQVELDVTQTLAAVSALKKTSAFVGVRLTVNSVMLKMIAEALKRSPHMNAHVRYNRATSVGILTLLPQINIATPLRGPDGRTITPVVEDVGGKSLRDVCLAMEDVKRRAMNTSVDCLLREAGLKDTWRRLFRGEFSVLRRVYPNLYGRGRVAPIPPDERRRHRSLPDEDRITADNLTSGTILVSNVGSVLHGVPTALGLLEIIPPQTTAIGLGSMTRRPLVARDDAGHETVKIRDVLPLTICIDHRAMDFEHVTGFIKHMSELCRDPARLTSAEEANATDSRF